MNATICRPVRGCSRYRDSRTQGWRPGLDSTAPPGLRKRGTDVGVRAWLLLIAAILGSGTLRAADTPGGSTYSVVICGLGGEPEYEKIFQGWGKDLSSALRKNAVSDDHVFWLAAKKEPGVYAESRQEQIARVLESLAARIEPQDGFQLFLIGHGSYDDYDYRINLPGPDMTASQLSELLGRIRAERQVVVNMTSSSGASIVPLRRKGRVVITATSAGRERNFSEFARYFIEALQDPAADADKNQEISALEAFRFATREVARYYQNSGRLATEHALLEDRGDQEGSREPAASNGEGLLASSAVMVRLGDQHAAADTPETRSLRAEKRKIEEEIETLKYRKAATPLEEYSQKLEKLLVSLAKVQEQLDQMEKK
jgi:hypothetical protein